MKIAIVVDMWLTGFDVPSLATMYVYKPMQIKFQDKESFPFYLFAMASSNEWRNL